MTKVSVKTIKNIQIIPTLKQVPEYVGLCIRASRNHHSHSAISKKVKQTLLDKEQNLNFS